MSGLKAELVVQAEEVLERLLTKKNRKDFLATVGPFLLVVTFIEDGLRIFLRWGEQIHYMTSVMGLCARPPPGTRLISRRGAHGEAGAPAPRHACPRPKRSALWRSPPSPWPPTELAALLSTLATPQWLVLWRLLPAALGCCPARCERTGRAVVKSGPRHAKCRAGAQALPARQPVLHVTLGRTRR